MKSLYLRIYATVVVVLLLFASASAWVFQRHIEQERQRSQSLLAERMSAWAELIERSIPGAQSAAEQQAASVRDWSQRLRLPLALDDAAGVRLGASESFIRRQGSPEGGAGVAIRLDDGRTLWVLRPNGMRPNAPEPRFGGPGDFGSLTFPLPFAPPEWRRAIDFLAVLFVLFIAVSAGAFPVVRRLTRRLEALKLGVEQFGAGALGHRVEASGRDEVAAVAASFNVAASRVEALVRSHQSLLANASHELRSPLARMKMAVSMLDDARPAQREALKHEIDTNVAELDALVEEVLLASRLDAGQTPYRSEPVELLAIAAEEAANVGAVVAGAEVVVQGDERLLRRALRNLLENARRYGGGDISVTLEAGHAEARLRVCDRGPGVPEALRERIFEAFYRLPGHAEQSGGVGLGLSLVKQIAERHGGSVHCEGREGGGSCFVLTLPGALLETTAPPAPRPAATANPLAA